jgi:glycosyltransferase involved in cell wall biosynthesis
MNSEKRFASVYQFHPGTNVGDAITNDMFQIQQVLRKAGYKSEIFAQHIASGLENRISPIAKYRGEAYSLLIVHHSMGFDSFEEIVKLPSRKILRYHNITPAHFFSSPFFKHYSDKGRQQLRAYRNFVEFAIGDSEYNRSELNELGYKYTASLPICFDGKVLLEQPMNGSLAQALSKTFNLLFVGRIAPNKKQIDLVRIFDFYRRTNHASRLILAGSWAGCEDYLEELQYTISKLELQASVELPGKISDADLATYYRSAHIFLSASEHEGFCVPLLEAMAFGLPILAFRSTAIPETLGPAGILFDSKEPNLWCEVIEQIRTNPALRKLIVSEQKERLIQFNAERTGERLLHYIRILEDAPEPFENSRPTVQIQGPFESSYSLAVVNRNLALSLDSEGTFDVSLHCTEGPGDYTPNETDLTDKPHSRWLWNKSKLLSRPPDVVIRNVYPPRTHDLPGRVKLLQFAWEDSLIPAEWAEGFNKCLTAIFVPSTHVEKVLRNSGVNVPIHVLRHGVEPYLLESQEDSRDASTFTFLNVSSGFPRKGIDLLLEAFFTEFRRSDNVRLLLKTFPNVHNQVAKELLRWKNTSSDPPECVHLDADISPRELLNLYREADCLVYPSRAEGFGLPVAEAMAQGIPVIVTNYGGVTDFCNEENAFLVNFDLVGSTSHFKVPGALWANPRISDLKRQMRFLLQNSRSELVRNKVEKAQSLIRESFTWPSVAIDAVSVLKEYVHPGIAPSTRLALITSWNTRCGIAEYSRYLIESLKRQCPELQIEVLSSPEEGIWPRNGVRSQVCWDQGPEEDLQILRKRLADGDFQIIHFQYNFGFFRLPQLGKIVRDLKGLGKQVIVTLHRTIELLVNNVSTDLSQISDSLRAADAIVVHTIADQKRLATLGITGNVKVIPQGMIAFSEEGNSRSELGITFDPIIATFGFLLPHKGLLELIDAIALLRSHYPKIALAAQCALHSDSTSRQFELTVRGRIAELGLDSHVLLSTHFLPEEEAAAFLQLSDLLVLPYSHTSESSSAAVRFALAVGRPVITTRQPIFEDVADLTHQVTSNHPQQLADAIKQILEDKSLSETLKERVRRYHEETSWEKVAKAHLNLFAKVNAIAKQGHQIESTLHKPDNDVAVSV